MWSTHCCFSCEFKHFGIFCLHFLGLIVANNDRVAGVPPCDGCFVDLEAGSTQVGNVDALVVFLVDCLQHDLLLLGVHLDDVVILRVRQVSYAPLKPLSGVLSDKDWVLRGDLHQVLLGVEAFGVLTDFIFPFDLANLLSSLPLAQKDFIGVLVPLFYQLSAIGEQVVQLTAPVAKRKVSFKYYVGNGGRGTYPMISFTVGSPVFVA